MYVANILDPWLIICNLEWRPVLGEGEREEGCQYDKLRVSPHHDLLTAHRELCSHTEPSLLSLNVSHRSALSLTVLRASVTTDAVIALRHYYRKVR